LSRAVLVVANDRRLRERLGETLRDAGWEPTLAASSIEAVSSIAANPPDVIIVDLGLDDVDGVDVIRILRAAEPRTPVLGVTSSVAPSRIMAAFRNGAAGCLLLDDLPARLLLALEELVQGEAPVSSRISKVLIKQVCHPDAKSSGDRPAVQPLTLRERAVLEQLARGLSYDDVASVLGVSVNTVRTYVRLIYEKLGVTSRTEAVLVAMKLGILGRPPLQRMTGRPTS
jgi:DNA-binding NarL/FixJ family response regulator